MAPETKMALRNFLKSATLRGSLLVISLFSLAAATYGQGQPQTTATPPPVARRVTGRPFPPPQYIPPHDYDQRNIKLDLHFDWDNEQAIGTATITLAPTVKDLRRVDLVCRLLLEKKN